MRIKITLPLICAALAALACALPGLTSPPAVQPKPGQTATSTVGAPALPNDQFILKLPDGSAVSLTVTGCEGMGAGGFLDLSAENELGPADAGRISVQVSGGNQGSGVYDNMYVSVIMGGTDKPVFSGNNPAVRVNLAGDGSGSFTGVEIVNISNTAPYEYGKAYKFNGEWSCKR